MTATVILAVKIMPDSPEAPLHEIEHTAREFMEKHGAKSLSLEKQDVAFGLKAIIIKCTLPEEKGTDLIETGLAHIAHVSSVTIEDYRRAFG